MTPQDLQRIRSSPGWRQHRVELLHDISLGSVIVKGQRTARPTWRYLPLDGFARLATLPLLKAAPAHGDARLDGLLRRKTALDWWQRGLRTLVDVHARDQYLSQAFARNFVASGDSLAMIDFEDDPLEVMTLEQAQARDWLAYLHSSALAFRLHSPAQRAERIALLRAEMARERAPVRRQVAYTAQRLRWLQRLPAGDGRGWHRHLTIFQTALGRCSPLSFTTTTRPQARR